LIKSITDWLPLSAIADVRIRDIFSDELQQWNARWFGKRAHFALAEFEAAKPQQPLVNTDAVWKEIGAGFAWQYRERQAIELAHHIVDAGQPRPRIADTDKGILIAVAVDALSDFASVFKRMCWPSDETLFDPATFRQFGGLYITLTLPKKIGLTVKVAMSIGACAALRKFVIEQPEKADRLNGHMVDAFENERVAVTVNLGEARLPARQLWDLASGDVIILDRHIKSEFPMVSARDGQHVCQLQFRQEEGTNTLIVAGD
jgi:hypothetical protein